MHHFEGSLRESAGDNILLFWGDIYAAAFPDHCVGETITNLATQASGVDRMLMSRDGKSIAVEEKTRHSSYNDFALEDFSDIARQSPGWIVKDLACDVLIYAVLPAREAFVFPYQELKEAWCQNSAEWTAKARARADGFSYVKALNGGYMTGSVAVPREMLLHLTPGARHIKTAPRHYWGPHAGQVIASRRPPPTPPAPEVAEVDQKSS